MKRIKKIKYLNEYKLELLFDDGKTKIVDFEDLIKEDGFYTLPLRDLKFFQKVKMDEFNYTICWPNGANFSPDLLYEIGLDANESKNLLPKTIRRKKSPTTKNEFKIQVTAKAKRISKKTIQTKYYEPN